MYRLVLPLLLVIALSGMSAASVAHSLGHEMTRGAAMAHDHSEMAGSHQKSHVEAALQDCCDTTGSFGSTGCFGDLFANIGLLSIPPVFGSAEGVPEANAHWAFLTPAVPTGPPKI